MLKEKLRSIAQYFFGKADIWVEGTPVDRTLTRPVVLGSPTVSEPSESQLKTGEAPAFPSYIAVEVTNVCNLKCKHCNYRFGLDHYTRERGFLDWDTFTKVMKEVKEHNIPVLMNYDGEPLMHKEFIKFLRYAHELGLNTYFNTNGTLFSKEFAQELVSFYRGSIFFSIDGDREWFHKIRVPANYDDVVQNLLYFLALNHEHGWPITVGVSCCNFGQSPVDRQNFLSEWIQRVNYVSMGEVNDKFGSIISDPMIDVTVVRRPVCVVPWQTCGVCFNGDVIPCSIYVTRANQANAIFGNIHEQSLEEIWQGDLYRKFRERLAHRQYHESYCDRCQRWRSQFIFTKTSDHTIEIERNGLWTTFRNVQKGQLNFKQ